MTAQSRVALKAYFETGDKPTQSQFADLIDSFARAGSVSNPTSEIVLYPGASSTGPLNYSGAMPYWKAISSGSQESYVSMGMYAKGRDGSGGGNLYFGVSGNYGRETMMYLETTGVLASCNRQVSFEPGFSSTGSFPSIRSEGIGTFGTDPDIPFGILSRGGGYIGFHTHGNGFYHGEAQGDVLQAMVSDASAANANVQMKGGRNTESDPSVLANSGNITNVNLRLGSQGSGSIRFFTDSKTYSRGVSGTDVEAFRIVHAASADNFISINPASNGVATVRALSSSNTNASLGIASQGTGNVNFYTATTGALQAQVTHTANPVNRLCMTGSVSGNPVEMFSQGEADVGIKLTPRGSAFVQFGTVVADATINNTGYIRIRDAGGTIRRIAVCSGN